MTVKECYSLIHGDYDEVKKRFETDERTQKFLRMLLRDENFAKLCEAMEEKDYEEAFLHAHAIKGISANLSLTDLFEKARILTELLRGGECSSEAMEAYERLKVAYDSTRKAVEKLCDSE